MKANEVPEKLYYAPYGDIREDNPITDNDIEYIRKNAFIEKAAEYLMDYEFNDSPTIADRRKRVEEFRKYMEGE